MDMTQEHCINLAEAWIVGAAYRAASVIEDARAIRVFEDDRPIQAAELAIVTAQRRQLDGSVRCLHRSGHADHGAQRRRSKHNTRLFHGSFLSSAG